MNAKLNQAKNLLARPEFMMGIRIFILTASLIAAFFVKTGVVSADPGWGDIGGK